MSQSDIYTVFCISVDEGRAFPIKIEKNETIGWLREVIKEKEPKIFANADSEYLDLYHVDIAEDINLMADVKAYPLDSKSPVQTTASLIEIFPDTPERHKIHFIVKLGKFHP